MGRGGGGRRLALLLCCATTLLISCTAVNGVLDESVRDFGRFARRWERDQLVNEVRRVRDVEEPLYEERSSVEQQEKPVEGIWEKARSFVSRVSESVGNGIPNPVSALPHKKPLVPIPEEESVGDLVPIPEEESVGDLLPFHRHKRSAHSHWAGMRDRIRHHLERVAAAGVSVKEPLTLDEDVNPASAFGVKITEVVSKVVEEYNAMEVEQEHVRSTCPDSLEIAVKHLVKRVKKALRKTVCNGVMASPEERSFCDRFYSIPMMTTFEAFAMTDLNPVNVPWQKVSKTAVCSPSSDFMESLMLLEGLASDSILLADMPMEDNHEHHIFHRNEHGQDHERHWWHKYRDMKHHRFENRPHWRDHERHHESRVEGELDSHGHEDGDHGRNWWQRMMDKHRHMKHRPHWRDHDRHHESRVDGELDSHGHEDGDHGRHWWQRMMDKHRHMKHHHFEDEHENHEKHPREEAELSPIGHEETTHEKHWLKKMFGPVDHEKINHEKHWWKRMFVWSPHKSKHIWHHGFNNGEDCLARNLKGLAKGARHHLVKTCKTTTDPNVISACKFAEEHGFLVLSWLAVKTPLWNKAAGFCADPPHVLPHAVNAELRHTPHFRVNHFERIADAGLPFDVNGIETPLDSVPHNRRDGNPKGCAFQRANMALRTALRLRGHVVVVSSRNNGEDGPEGTVHTVLTVLKGYPIHLQDLEAVKNAQSLDEGFSEGQFAELLLRKFVKESGLVREAETSEHRTEPDVQTQIMEFKPFHNGPHFRISANPHQRATPLSEGHHFRISATPRMGSEAGNEAPLVELSIGGEAESTAVGNSMVEESTAVEGAVVELQDKTAKDASENRAIM